MTTLAELRPLVASDLRDPSMITFTSAIIDELVNAALAEIGRIIPGRFRTDIATVADQLDYVITPPSGAAGPEIELKRVEIWDASVTPRKFVSKLQPVRTEFASVSAAGWEFWNGTLTLTNAAERVIDPTKHVLRVWGYAPYAKMLVSNNVVALSVEQEYALRDYVRVEAIKMLMASRELYTQWQTASRNTDVSLAALNGLYAQFSDSWRRRSRALQVLREAD